MKKQVCVIGAARFGAAVARELYQSGHDVLVIDTDEAKVQDLSGQVTYAVRADASNEAVLRQLDVADFDVAVVALAGENVQTSIMITVLLKSIGVPYVIARAANELHGSTLEKVGADRIVYPEMESAWRTAHIGFDPGGYGPHADSAQLRNQQDTTAGADDRTHVGGSGVGGNAGQPGGVSPGDSAGPQFISASGQGRANSGRRRADCRGKQLSNPSAERRGPRIAAARTRGNGRLSPRKHTARMNIKGQAGKCG